jgi:hypothetical protein
MAQHSRHLPHFVLGTLGAMCGALSDAIVCVVYGCLHLAILGKLVPVIQEWYVIPIIALLVAGATGGIGIGILVGLTSRAALSRSVRSSVLNWTIQGAVAGAAQAPFVAYLGRSYNGEPFDMEFDFVIMTIRAGAIVGCGTALIVGLTLVKTLGQRCPSGQSRWLGTRRGGSFWSPLIQECSCCFALRSVHS